MTPEEIAAYANAIAHGLGLQDAGGRILAFEAPRTPARRAAVTRTLRGALDAVRPSEGAPSIGETLEVLLEPPRRASARPRGDSRRRALAECQALVARAAHRRTKRAERERLFVQLLVLFGVAAALGFDTDPDGETALRLARRGVDAWLHR